MGGLESFTRQILRLQCLLHEADLHCLYELPSATIVGGRVDPDIHLEFCQCTHCGQHLPPTIALESRFTILQSLLPIEQHMHLMLEELDLEFPRGFGRS